MYSYSQLKCYQQCPRKYKLRYIDKLRVLEESIELFLGKRVHEVLKKLYQDLIHCKKNSLHDLLCFLHTEWARQWNDSILIVNKELNPDDYFHMAKKYIADYYRRYYPFTEGKTLMLEGRIIIHLDGSNKRTLQGYIDRLSVTDDGIYEIHEYKTCSRVPTLEDLRKDLQLILYSIGVKQKYPTSKDLRLVFHLLKFDQEITISLSSEDLEEATQHAIQLMTIIENETEFRGNPSRLCEWCSFKWFC